MPHDVKFQPCRCRQLGPSAKLLARLHAHLLTGWSGVNLCSEVDLLLHLLTLPEGLTRPSSGDPAKEPLLWCGEVAAAYACTVLLCSGEPWLLCTCKPRNSAPVCSPALKQLSIALEQGLMSVPDYTILVGSERCYVKSCRCCSSLRFATVHRSRGLLLVRIASREQSQQREHTVL